MKQFAGLVSGLSSVLDKMSGLLMVSIMLLIVANIFLRVLFNHPVLGAYEYVGFLTAALIGLSLANCAVKKGHIAISFLVERLPERVQAVVDIFINTAALLFWGFSAWYICAYAKSIAVNGVVSATTQTPISPFIYLVAIGLFVFCLVLLANLIESIKKAAFDR